jgi:hypothetical protein
MSSIEIQKHIDVIIYSYKGKILKNTVDNIVKMSSGNNIIKIKIFDQFPLNRKDVFNEFSNLEYIHIFWDHIKSPCIYKFNAIKTSSSDYMLVVADNVELAKNWDINLINFVGNKHLIVSGNGKTKISHNGIYYLSKEVDFSDTYNLTNWIDRGFIFSQSITLRSIPYPTYVKYNGEEEIASATYFCNNIDIFSTPTNMYNKIGINSLENTYHTFSKDHNYNELIKLLKTGENKYINLNSMPRSMSEFLSFHSISSDYIKPLPFPNTDVEYDPTSMPFDKIDSKKFMTKVNYIS